MLIREVQFAYIACQTYWRKCQKRNKKKPFWYICWNCSLIRVNEFDRMVTLWVSDGNKSLARHLWETAAVQVSLLDCFDQEGSEWERLYFTAICTNLYFLKTHSDTSGNYVALKVCREYYTESFPSSSASCNRPSHHFGSNCPKSIMLSE